MRVCVYTCAYAQVYAHISEFILKVVRVKFRDAINSVERRRILPFRRIRNFDSSRFQDARHHNHRADIYTVMWYVARDHVVATNRVDNVYLHGAVLALVHFPSVYLFDLHIEIIEKNAIHDGLLRSRDPTRLLALRLARYTHEDSDRIRNIDCNVEIR